MKPQNLVTGLPIRHLEAVTEQRSRSSRIPVGVVVERRKAASPWIDFIWRPIAVLAGQPDTPPWTALADDGERATFYAGRGDGRTASHRNRQLPRQSRERVAVAVGGAARNRRRAALRALSRHRRSGRGRRHDGGRQQHRRAGADAGHGARCGCGVRCRAPCRRGVREAQARPRRPGVARTPRAGDGRDER